MIVYIGLSSVIALQEGITLLMAAAAQGYADLAAKLVELGIALETKLLVRVRQRQQQSI